MSICRTLSALAFFLVTLTAAQAAVYHIRGVVLELRPDAKTAVIRHEAVPGLMPAMTMPFATSAEEIRKLSVDDQVEFEFVMEGGSPSFARNFEVVGVATPREEDEPPEQSQSRAPKLVEGSVAPEVELIAQDGTSIPLRGEGYRYTLLTFIFTRCPVPEFCPLITGQFAQIHTRLTTSDLRDEVRLLSITIDPEFDTPEVLREYGEAFGADFQHWSFATADPDTIDFVASAFRLFRQRNGAQLDHALCTALLAPDGTVLEIWRGNAWKVDDVMDSIKASASRKPSKDSK